MAETASSHCFTNNYSFSISSLPFEEVPGQSRLFVDYQKNPTSLRRFYPEAVSSHVELSSRIEKVLASYEVDRQVLCDALEATNRYVGATDATLANINLLRDPQCVAVVSGQQAGLFSGPVYTIYKALSAVRMAKCLRDRGHKAVPVFWIATEDHDFEEVSRTAVISKTGLLTPISVASSTATGIPVGNMPLDDSVSAKALEMMSKMQGTEHSPWISEILSSTWRPGEKFGDAFAKMLMRLLGKFGIIVLCPLNTEIKRLAAPMYRRAAERAGNVVEALRARSAELEKAGYHAQVHIGEDYFPLFWQNPEGARKALRRSGDDTVATKDHSHEFPLDQILKMIEDEPSDFSPSVTLRSVIQDFLLPTVTYFGGAAEIAYFAQSAEVYRVLDRPVTPILHRQSFTVIEPKHRKTLEKYGLALTDLFSGIDSMIPKLVESHLNKDGAAKIDDAAAAIEREFARIESEVLGLDQTLGDNLARRKRKINYHLDAIRKKFHDAQMRKDGEVRTQVETMFTTLFPNNHLQERSVNVLYFLNRYGESFIDWLYESIDLDEKGHRIVLL
ncbi:MAG: bacillithiol biosynthesis cysteine-adding enzyme BshC [Acidobacteriota bacterium]